MIGMGCKDMNRESLCGLLVPKTRTHGCTTLLPEKVLFHILSEVFMPSLQELSYLRIIRKNDGGTLITAVERTVQEKGAMVHRLEGSPERARLLWKRLWESKFCQLLRFCRGWSDIRVTSETDLSCDQVAEHRLKS